MAVEGQKAELLAKALLDMEAAIANADRLKDNAKRYLRKLKELAAEGEEIALDLSAFEIAFSSTHRKVQFRFEEIRGMMK